MDPMANDTKTTGTGAAPERATDYGSDDIGRAIAGAVALGGDRAIRRLEALAASGRRQVEQFRLSAPGLVRVALSGVERVEAALKAVRA